MIRFRLLYRKQDTDRETHTHTHCSFKVRRLTTMHQNLREYTHLQTRTTNRAQTHYSRTLITSCLSFY